MRLAALACAALLAASPAWAQPAPEASRHEAVAFGAAIGIDAQVTEALARIHGDLLRRTMAQNGKALDVDAPLVDELLMPSFTARRDQLTAVMLEPWARHFTAAELRLLRNFFASPLGQRYLALQPTIATETSQGVEDWSRRVFSNIVENETEELRARGLRF